MSALSPCIVRVSSPLRRFLLVSSVVPCCGCGFASYSSRFGHSAPDLLNKRFWRVPEALFR
eukprot:9601697-Alexandrium_andersonii.AAC.1